MLITKISLDVVGSSHHEFTPCSSWSSTADYTTTSNSSRRDSATDFSMYRRDSTAEWKDCSTDFSGSQEGVRGAGVALGDSSYGSQCCGQEEAIAAEKGECNSRNNKTHVKVLGC